MPKTQAHTGTSICIVPFTSASSWYNNSSFAKEQVISYMMITAHLIALKFMDGDNWYHSSTTLRMTFLHGYQQETCNQILKGQLYYNYPETESDNNDSARSFSSTAE